MSAGPVGTGFGPGKPLTPAVQKGTAPYEKRSMAHHLRCTKHLALPGSSFAPRVDVAHFVPDAFPSPRMFGTNRSGRYLCQVLSPTIHLGGRPARLPRRGRPVRLRHDHLDSVARLLVPHLEGPWPECIEHSSGQGPFPAPSWNLDTVGSHSVCTCELAALGEECRPAFLGNTRVRNPFQTRAHGLGRPARR